MRQAGRLVVRPLKLQVVADDRFLLFVVFGVQRRDGIRCLRDRRLQARRLFGDPDETLALGLNAIAQLLDFAFGLENAPRLIAASPGHQMGTMKHIAGAGDDGQWRQAARVGCVIVRLRNPCIAQGLPNRGRMRTVRRDDGSQRHQAGRGHHCNTGRRRILDVGRF